MKALEKNKGILIAIVIFVIVIFAYNTFKDNFVHVLAPDQSIGADMVDLYASLNVVKLNTDMLSSPLYMYLNDFSVELLPRPAGRVNPFSPIGLD